MWRVLKCSLWVNLKISTHTPLARCGSTLCYVRTFTRFISTHTPLARCGKITKNRHFNYIISTHTPLARCGARVTVFSVVLHNFNSHTPREVWRHLLPAAHLTKHHFNSHTPREVWHISAVVLIDLLHFNSHTPREVWLVEINNRCIGLTFQLTHPSRGVAHDELVTLPYYRISTHTPLARCGRPLQVPEYAEC